jgi:hypothetical protein
VEQQAGGVPKAHAEKTCCATTSRREKVSNQSHSQRKNEAVRETIHCVARFVVIGFAATKSIKDETKENRGDCKIQNLECGQFEQMHRDQPDANATSNCAHSDVAENSEQRLNGLAVPAK